MNSYNGQSPEIYAQSSGNYNREGRIAVLSSDNNTYFGDSSNTGNITQMARIYWTITQVSEGEFEGGITGVDWFFKDPNSPFYNETWNSEQKIWNELTGVGAGSLSRVFVEWNNRISTDGIIDFMDMLGETTCSSNNCYDLYFG